MLCLFQLLFPDVVAYGNTSFFFEQARQVTCGQFGTFSKILNGNPFLDVGVYIINANRDRLGHSRASCKNSHFTSKIQNHVVVKVDNLLTGMKRVKL